MKLTESQGKKSEIPANASRLSTADRHRRIGGPADSFLPIMASQKYVSNNNVLKGK